MKKMMLVVTVLIGFCSVAWAQMQQQQQRPNQRMPMQQNQMQQQNCNAQLQNRQQTNQDLNMCISGWTKTFGPTESDPPDDCARKLHQFVAAARVAKKCVQHGMRH